MPCADPRDGCVKIYNQDLRVLYEKGGYVGGASAKQGHVCNMRWATRMR